MDKYIELDDVKLIREKMKIFAGMANEIMNVFNDIDSIQINNIDIMDFNTVLQASINIPIKSDYLDITIEPKKGKVVTNSEDIKDLLQSALKESQIVEKGKGIHSLFKTFLTTNKISYVHNMVGSTKESLINHFDKLIESQDNYELTFAQKIKKFNK